jgi:hypothetical protein
MALVEFDFLKNFLDVFLMAAGFLPPIFFQRNSHNLNCLIGRDNVAYSQTAQFKLLCISQAIFYPQEFILFQSAAAGACTAYPLGFVEH